MNAVVPLPSLAQYPALYTSARAALFRCDQIDECQQWANHAAALSSYALQAKDETLEAMAARIRARAVRRCGELLNAMGKNPGGHVADNFPRKMQAASDAGMSRKQYIQSVAIAKIPEQKFEKLVESRDPPPLYKLAEHGVSKRGGSYHGGGRKTGSRIVREISAFAVFCEINPPEVLAKSFAQSEQITAIRKWCEKLLARAAA